MEVKPDILSKLRENGEADLLKGLLGAADLLKVLIFNSSKIMTGNPSNVSPKAIASGLINTLVLPDTFLNTLAPQKKGASPPKVILFRLVQPSKALL